MEHGRVRAEKTKKKRVKTKQQKKQNKISQTNTLRRKTTLKKKFFEIAKEQIARISIDRDGSRIKTSFMNI